MKKILVIIFMLLAYVWGYAQFPSSERVYCYVYDYTSNDGIRSKDNRTTYYFVNFQNEMMGFATASDLKRIRQELLEDPDYYKNAAIQDLAYSYGQWKSSPAGLPTMGPARATVTIIKYDSQYSTSAKNTYRKQSKAACHSGNIWDSALRENYWSKPTWGTLCYSFSKDRKEMIIWETSDSENRDYYKLVNISDLIPNTDFLH